jgi:VanZ family protein
MVDSLRKPLFLVAVGLIFIVLLIELGSGLVAGFGARASGIGIPYLALLDGLLAFTIGLIACSLLIPERAQGRIQGIATLIVSLIVIIVGIAQIFTAVGKLFLMLGLLLTPIFGVIAYLLIFAGFPRAEAAVSLSLLMTLKLFFAGFMVFAHQRFLQNKGLVLLTLSSFAATIIISFLHGFVPGFLASITDAIAGIVVAIIAVIWAIFFLVGSIISIVKAIA